MAAGERARDPDRPNAELDAAAKRYAALVARALGDQLVSIVRFDAVARGAASVGSDVALLIVADDLPPSRVARVRLLERVDREFEPELARLRESGLPEPRVTRLLLTPKQARRVRPFYADIAANPAVLYDRDGFFASVLAAVRSSCAHVEESDRAIARRRDASVEADAPPADVFEL